MFVDINRNDVEDRFYFKDNDLTFICARTTDDTLLFVCLDTNRAYTWDEIMASDEFNFYRLHKENEDEFLVWVER